MAASSVYPVVSHTHTPPRPSWKNQQLQSPTRLADTTQEFFGVHAEKCFPDNARLSVTLILCLCPERGGRGGGNRNTVNASLHGRLKEAEPRTGRGARSENRPQIIRPRCHIQQPQASGLPFFWRDAASPAGRCGFCSPLVS